MAGPSQHEGFTGVGRSIVDEDEITLTSVGVDIGSSTSHLVFSRLELERQDTRYVIVKRTVLRQSEILLTPYLDEGATIDSDALGRFIAGQYKAAGIEREEVDTGALILTGVAVLRHNARAIGELFAADAGKFVAVSAGDGMEATMAAHGSGAVAESRKSGDMVMSIDVGGGTTKVALCQGGVVREVTAVDVGARLLAFDEGGVVTRVEEAGRTHAKQAGIDVAVGTRLSGDDMEAIASVMADRLDEVVTRGELSNGARALLRLPRLSYRGAIDTVIFSGGVSEFIYGHESQSFGDLGPLFAKEIKERVGRLGAIVMVPVAGIRATVIGASQYTIQVSGSTIYIAPLEAVPLRNLPVVTPELDLTAEVIEPAAVSQGIVTGLRRLDLAQTGRSVALAVHWGGSATYARLDGFCAGVVQAMRQVLDKGNPLVLVSDGDVGGLLGLHLREELRLTSPVVSIDGVELREFDYIDIGELIPSSGAVPVVIKSLVFPGSA